VLDCLLGYAARVIAAFSNNSFQKDCAAIAMKWLAIDRFNSGLSSNGPDI
jgi:hypothetical protein